ncbi:MAG TPA: RNA-binding cell elongation regulator Jag/EloR [Thermoleophilia bacterium]|nr:RNA-binding cell elongation regulator Jag/EloR [Thermoleophilia bacterium]
MAEPDDYRPVDDTEDEETEFATVADATTVEDAKRKALEQLRKVVPYVDERDVEFVVVEEGVRGGLFGRGKMLAQVEARLRPSNQRIESDTPPAAEALREFVETVLHLMGIGADVSVSESTDTVRADVAGDDLGLLIGRHGSTIDALQSIAGIAINGDRRERRQIIIDAEGYRRRREMALASLADRTVLTVTRDGASITLQPMSAAERKVIHLYLKDDPRVTTASDGNEPFRAVVISLRSVE